MENEILKQWQRDYPSIPADAIQAGYKAYLQQQADEKVGQQPRPQQATQTPKVSPAVENYLRSLRSDSPLAGKLKG